MVQIDNIEQITKLPKNVHALVYWHVFLSICLLAIWIYENKKRTKWPKSVNLRNWCLKNNVRFIVFAFSVPCDFLSSWLLWGECPVPLLAQGRTRVCVFVLGTRVDVRRGRTYGALKDGTRRNGNNDRHSEGKVKVRRVCFSWYMCCYFSWGVVRRCYSGRSTAAWIVGRIW